MNKSAVALQWSKVCSEFMCTYYDAGVSSFRVLLSRREGGSGGRVGGRQMELFSEKERPFSPWASPVTHTHTHTPVTTILMDWCMIIVNMSSAYCRSLLLVLCWLLILHASLCYYIITFDIISKRFMKHSLFYVFFFPLWMLVQMTEKNWIKEAVLYKEKQIIRNKNIRLCQMNKPFK